MHSDVCFVHPPSIYDFRTRELIPGPISDVVPSTPIFEMYPIGFLSMLSYISDRGYSGRIANIATRMILSSKFDAKKYISGIDADVFGIDLHWLPHVHGAMNMARIIREAKPDAKIIMGGFSASYFSTEIMSEHPEVDYVLKGDFQEFSLFRLLEEIGGSNRLENVPSLVYRSGAAIKSNPASRENSPENVFLDYRLLLKNAIRYHDIAGHLPYADWINNPEAVTLIEHGCQFNCSFCGGSNFAYRNNFFGKSPVYRDPARIAEEIELAQEVLGAPVFIAGDLNNAGEKYYESFFAEVRNRGIDIPLLTEYFVPPSREYFIRLGKVFPDFTAEISPESSSTEIRRFNGRFYTNEQLESSLSAAREEGCKKFDVYFTIGISHQGPEELRNDIKYATELMSKYAGSRMKVFSFMSPLTPFIDPGSLIYEKPEFYGFHITARTLREYYDLLDKGKSWVDFLNYFTDWMDKGSIERLTYESEIEMMKARIDLGLISRERGQRIIDNITHYLRNEPYEASTRKDSHLSYLNKDIEWSRKHKLTEDSFLIFWYRNLKVIERNLLRKGQ
ncbi:MAG: TIGR04190 family B12-binding domain/radical SAM domain protein [Thermoplasmataceae archaeon]